MFKKIWQSFMRWIRKTFGKGTNRSMPGTSHLAHDRVITAELPPLDDTDREYLFMQLLEGVAHGWQQPRAVAFFNKIRQRVRKSEWLEWLDKFGNNLLNAPVPNYELAGRMVQLSQLDCGEIGDLAGEYGVRLLNRQASESPEFLPIIEFGEAEFAEFDDDDRETGFAADDEIDRPFDELPPELLLDLDPLPAPPPRSFQHQPEADTATETREITLEEFAAMLHQDPNLVAELAEQFGIQTTDPQVIINAVIAQMQQQVQPISGDISSAPPSPAAVESPTTTPSISHLETQSPPPPPPAPTKLEYSSDDPWSNGLGTSEASRPEPAKSPDRGV